VAPVLDLFAIVVKMVDLYAIAIEFIGQTLVQNLGAIHKDLNVVALWLATMEKVVVDIETIVIWLFVGFNTCFFFHYMHQKGYFWRLL
jgi:hypothetical protein